MQNRIVEVSSDGAYLNVSRGFLVVTIDKEKAGQVAIEDIGALIIRGHGSSFSVNICARLAEANVPIIICGSNQAPDSVIWPVSGHFAQGLHMQAQAVANKPLLKRLWAQLVIPTAIRIDPFDVPKLFTGKAGLEVQCQSIGQEA